MSQVAWMFGKTRTDWQTGVIIPTFKKGDRKQCTNYRGISLLSLPGKVYAKYLERKCREIVESKLKNGQCGFCPGRSTTGQIFALKQIFEKSWEYGKDLFACFVDLEKAYDRVPRDKLRKVLREYGVKLWLHQCDYEILTHGINFFADNLFLFKLTLVEAKFLTEQILPEYPCFTSENLKLSPQNSVLISEKFALVETTYVFRINTEWAVGVIV